MALGPSGRRQEPLHVFAMAAALVLAAFLGGALGLIWDAVGFGADDTPGSAQAGSAD